MEEEKKSRRDTVSEQSRFIMQMWSRRSSGTSHRSDWLDGSEKNEITLLHGDFAQVGVAGLESQRVFDPHEIAV